MFVLLFLKAGAKIGTIISSMQAFGQKKLKKMKDFFLPLFKAKRINKLDQKTEQKKLIEKIPNKAKTQHSIAVRVVWCSKIIIVRNARIHVLICQEKSHGSNFCIYEGID